MWLWVGFVGIAAGDGFIGDFSKAVRSLFNERNSRVRNRTFLKKVSL